MLIYHNPDHGAHHGRQEMYRGHLVPCHETPSRLDYVLAELRSRRLGTLLTPSETDLRLVERVHSPRYLEFLSGAWNEWLQLDPANAELDALPSLWPVRGFRHDVLPRNFAARMGLFSFDAGTPITAGTWNAAKAGAGCAIDAARAVAHAKGAGGSMALTRPPGHHAGPDFFGGYCFLNNAAIAAQTLREEGAARVAVLDIDYHHGNGTQTIFYERADVLTVSIHGDPATEYPFYLGYADEHGSGPGAGCNRNFPLPEGSTFPIWRQALTKALDEVSRFGAGALVVALGVDTFEGDPISKFALASAHYLEIGRTIARAALPTVFVLEGGYAVAEVGVNVANVLEGFIG